eukprot:1159844-Pelagomonas_calceolata.AAC.1
MAQAREKGHHGREQQAAHGPQVVAVPQERTCSHPCRYLSILIPALKSQLRHEEAPAATHGGIHGHELCEDSQPKKCMSS